MTIRLCGKDVSIIDMHAHLRNSVLYHTLIAKRAGIDLVVAMPNTDPCLDNLKTIKTYTNQGAVIPFVPMSAITIGREGKELVDISEINRYVVGFTDDGNCLKDLGLLRSILDYDCWVMLHAGEDDPTDKWPRETTEPEWVEKYLELNRDVGGKLYIQHVSRAASVALIRAAKKDEVPVTAETCPHYFKWTRDTMRVPVNPPIGNENDREAVRSALADGTIDIIASDYAPEPRPKQTGIADWDNYINSCTGLIEGGVLTEDQLKMKIYTNPRKIIESSDAVKEKT